MAMRQQFRLASSQQLLPPYRYLNPFDILVIIPHHTLHGIPLHMIWLVSAHEFFATAHGITYCSSSPPFSQVCGSQPAAQR